MVNKIIVAHSNTEVTKHTFPDSNASFVFIDCGEAVYYVNTTEGKMYKTERPELNGLCEEHKALLA